MKRADVQPGQVFVNRYGMLLRVERVEKRGVVRVWRLATAWFLGWDGALRARRVTGDYRELAVGIYEAK